MCVQKFIYPIYIEKRIFSVFTKWHIYFCSVYITVNDNISKSGEGTCQARSCSCSAACVQPPTSPVSPNYPLPPSPSPSPPPPALPLLLHHHSSHYSPPPSPSPPPPALPFSLPSMHPGLHGQKLPPYFVQTEQVCLSSSDFENQIKRCPFTCLHITISLFTDMLLGCNSNTAY